MGAVMMLLVGVVTASVAEAVGVKVGVGVGVRVGVGVGMGVAVGSGVRLGTGIGLWVVGVLLVLSVGVMVGWGISRRGRTITQRAATATNESTASPRSSHGLRLCIGRPSVPSRPKVQVRRPLRAVLYPIGYRLASGRLSVPHDKSTQSLVSWLCEDLCSLLVRRGPVFIGAQTHEMAIKAY